MGDQNAIRLLGFVELKGFRDDWSDLGLDDDDLLELQLALIAGPTRPPVVAGTGGLRKVRFSPSRWSRGKSGAIRVGYAYFERRGLIALIVAFPKNERGDLSAAERNALKPMIEALAAQFS